MNTYGAFWKGQSVEIEAETLFAAKTKAIEVFQAGAGRKKVKAFEVSVLLAAKGGVPVVHIADF